MQPMVAVLHMPAMPERGETDIATVSLPRSVRPIRCPKVIMVPLHISVFLTIMTLDLSQVCLRQGCTLLATYKCTLGQVWGLRTEGEKSASEWISGGP